VHLAVASQADKKVHFADFLDKSCAVLAIPFVDISFLLRYISMPQGGMDCFGEEVCELKRSLRNRCTKVMLNKIYDKEICL
jgi:hypothetical protein